MVWVISAVVALAVLAVIILFLNRFYIKSTRESSLVRTGAGGQKVVIDNGCFALPMLHQVQKVTMRTIAINVDLLGQYSLITADKLRVDMEMEFHIRVDPTTKGVAAAAQALGSKSHRTEELKQLIEGKLMDAVRAVAATKTMDELHVARGTYVQEVAKLVRENISQNGLILESAAMRRFDQAPFSSLDENNAFNAVGMRLLSEVIADNRKERIKIEADADIAVRLSQLEQTQRRLDIERQQKQAEIETRKQIERLSAATDAEIAQAKSEAARQTRETEISDDLQLKEVEITRDLILRQKEMEALLKVEQVKIDNAIVLAAKRRDELDAQAKSEQARTHLVEAQEQVQTHKDRLVAKRSKELALLKAQEAASVEAERIKSQVDSLMSTAKAEASATTLKATAEKAKLQAESEGRAALIDAENSQSDELIKMKIEMHRLDKLPEIATQMMKPVEKIESIRINHIGGFGGGGGEGSKDTSPFNQAIESVLGMAVQLPAMKSLGAEIGLDFDAGLATRMSDAASRSKLNTSEAPKVTVPENT
ncbi:MAG: hypothetical protein JKY04_01005 [Sneathiella sp.]|nr:hypothetical protein [Sneathiella sp.]